MTPDFGLRDLAPSVVAWEGAWTSDERILTDYSIEIPKGPVTIYAPSVGTVGAAWCRRGERRLDGAVPIEIYRGYAWIDREVSCGVDLVDVEIAPVSHDLQVLIFTKARLAAIRAFLDGETFTWEGVSLKPRRFLLEHS